MIDLHEEVVFPQRNLIPDSIPLPVTLNSKA
jgi:hypothetical protein